MLLMKDRSFLYELRAYLIYVKVGETGVVWPCLKVFWLSKDNSEGQCREKEEEVDRRGGGKTILKKGQE